MDRRLAPHGIVRHNDFVLKFWHEPYEMTVFPDGRAIIKGTTDTAVARSPYARPNGRYGRPFKDLPPALSMCPCRGLKRMNQISVPPHTPKTTLAPLLRPA